MNTETTTQPTVADLLDRLEELNVNQQELDKAKRDAKRDLYQLKAQLKSSLTPEAIEEEKKAKRRELRDLNKIRYITKNGLTIYNLRQAGNTVNVMHIRYADVPGVAVATPVPSYLRGAFDFMARGGATHITILRPDGSWTCTSSVCHVDDSFDYKMGVKLALDLFTQDEADALLTPIEKKEE